MSKAIIAANQTQSVAMPAVADDLNGYLSKIASFKVLTVDEEQALARRLRDKDDLDAARDLIMSQLRFVVHIARTYKGYGLPMADLVQEGNIGLMKAVKRFDPDVGVRLISFAVHWIRAEIHEYVIRNWRIVKVATTKAQRKLFFKLRSTKKRLNWFSQEEVAAVAKDLGVDPEVVMEMESRMTGSDNAFDAPSSAGEEQRALAPAETLHQDDQDPYALLEKSDGLAQSVDGLASGMAQLDDRSRDIVQRRWLQEGKCTLHDLAAEYDVSAERIRQIEKSAMLKLRKFIEAEAA